MTEKKVGARPGRPPRGGPTPVVLTMRGGAAWKEWLLGWANALGTTPSDLIDRALTEKAEKDGRSGPPARYPDQVRS